MKCPWWILGCNTLLKAIPTNMQVIFVGDKDQLPSVGPGQVLHDLLQINEIPKCELNRNLSSRRRFKYYSSCP